MMLDEKHAMQILPSNKDKWLALILFPFKAYIVVAFIFYPVFRMFCPEPFLGDDTIYAITNGYWLCFIALFLGAFFQLIFSESKHAMNSFVFVIFPIGLVFLVDFIVRHFL